MNSGRVCFFSESQISPRNYLSTRLNPCSFLFRKKFVRLIAKRAKISVWNAAFGYTLPTYKTKSMNQQFVSRVFTLLRSFDSTDFYGAMWRATAANNVFRTLFIAANSKKIRQAASHRVHALAKRKPLDKNYTEKSQAHEHRAAVITIFRVRNKIKKKLLII